MAGLTVCLMVRLMACSGACMMASGLGGTGSPAQGVVGKASKAHGEASSSENRAHWPGGDGESSPGGVRSLL